MNQILLGNLKPETSNRINEARPEKIKVDKFQPINQKWAQCKIMGKNINIRSYSAAAAHFNILYVYGGYQILNGIQDDFYSINLDHQEKQYQWNLIQPKGQYPGPRARHCLIAGQNGLYLFGGLKNDVKSSNSIYLCDYLTHKWTKLSTLGEIPPCLDSFGSTYLCHEGQEKIIIFGGYSQKINDYSNEIIEYNITKNKWSMLSEGGTKQKPQKRNGCSLTGEGDNIYIFGGKNDEKRLNDLWHFDLKKYQLKKLEPKGNMPISRNGHTFNYYKGHLYLFGGIHDITWELDDLVIYDIENNQWVTLEQESPRKTDNKTKANLSNPEMKIKQDNKDLNKKKLWYDTSPSIYKRHSINQANIIRENSGYQNTQQDNHSPGKMIDEQRRKAFFNRKTQMLKNFQVKDKEKQMLINMQTMSQAMKNTLDVIGLPNKSPDGKLSDFGKTSISKFLQPLSNSEKDNIGKKPCARDGHCSAIINSSLYIFGGDRHQMSFNDIYKLDLGKAEMKIKDKE